jgi:hypothetical protein
MAAQGWLSTPPCSHLTDTIDRIWLQTKFKSIPDNSERPVFFSRGNAATLISLKVLTLPTAKGGGVDTIAPDYYFRVPTRSWQPGWPFPFLAGRSHAIANSPVDGFPRYMSD